MAKVMHVLLPRLENNKSSILQTKIAVKDEDFLDKLHFLPASQNTFQKPATTLGLVKQTFWRVPLFTE